MFPGIWRKLAFKFKDVFYIMGFFRNGILGSEQRFFGDVEAMECQDHHVQTGIFLQRSLGVKAPKRYDPGILPGSEIPSTAYFLAGAWSVIYLIFLGTHVQSSPKMGRPMVSPFLLQVPINRKTQDFMGFSRGAHFPFSAP